MAKRAGQYIQTQPGLFIDGTPIPVIDQNKSFKYLGKLFNFQMDNNDAKQEIESSVRLMLSTTTNLHVRPQTKLKIVRKIMPTQFSFQLRLYDISLTWIHQSLDSLLTNCVRDWLDLPISTCVSEFMALPLSEGGYAIPSFKHQAESLRLGQRYRLHHSVNSDVLKMWSQTSS